MTRPYGVKGRKRKGVEAKDDEQVQSKRCMTQNDEVAVEEDELVDIGIPIVPSYPKSDNPNLIFVLERASLEVAKVGKTYQLLNSNDHDNFLRKNNKNPLNYRPDITHQALLSILDSPLNKAGRLRAVYIKTEKGVLIEVKPYVKIPRTYKRFAGVMLQLLQKLRISSQDGKLLLRTIKNPVTQYLPINSRKIGFSVSSKKLVNINDYVSTVPSDMDFVFVVGAMAKGKVEAEYTEDGISISAYPLSAAYCISMICGALKEKWKIL